MASFEKRLLEVEQALRAKGLLADEDSLSVDVSEIEFQDKPKEVFRCVRQAHALSVNGFRDGAVLVTMCILLEPSIHIALLALPSGRTWRVLVDPMLSHRCSRELMSLWNSMPNRKNDEKGTFTQKNGLFALSRMAESFASMQV